MNKTLAYFSPDMAKEVGLTPAILYQELLWNSQSEIAEDYDEDGWFYYTAKKFEDRTGFKRTAYAEAVKILEDLGLIERKKAYIKGTSKSVNHFRCLKSWQPVDREANNGACSPSEQPIYKENKKENTTVVPASRHPESNFSSLSGTSEASGEAKGDPVEPAVATGDPFGQPVTKPSVVSLKNEKTQADKNKDRAWVVVNKIVKKCREHGMKVAEKHVKLHAVVMHQLFVAERSEEDIMLALDKYLATTDPFYSPAKRSVDSALSKDYIEVYLNMDYKPKQTPKSYTF